MYIDEILYKIVNGQNGFYSFETFILNLLKVHLKSQEKELRVVENNRISIDAVANDGFDNFTGKTVIDVKLNFGKVSPRFFFDRFFRPTNELFELEAKYYLIINGREINERIKERYISEFKIFYPNIELVIWGPEEINRIAYKHRTETKKIVDNIFSLRIEQVLENENVNWKDEREKIILSLIDTFKNRQFSLFLGAGVSSSAGMPNWNKLLNSLFVSYLTNEFDKSKNITDKDINEIVDRLNQVDEQSALMAAKQYPNNNLMMKLLLKQLQRVFMNSEIKQKMKILT
jgi:hypothetical protein